MVSTQNYSTRACWTELGPAVLDVIADVCDFDLFNFVSPVFAVSLEGGVHMHIRILAV